MGSTNRVSPLARLVHVGVGLELLSANIEGLMRSFADVACASFLQS